MFNNNSIQISLKFYEIIHYKPCKGTLAFWNPWIKFEPFTPFIKRANLSLRNICKFVSEKIWLMNKGQDLYCQYQLKIYDSKDETKMLKGNKSVDCLLRKAVVASLLLTIAVSSCFIWSTHTCVLYTSRSPRD